MGDWGPLGDVLESAESDRNKANVKDLVVRAKDLLKLVRETFPAYTMHDEQHAGNVIRLMGRLAAPRLEVMTPLEAALLILAAYFHDAGMAYSAEEIARIPEEDEFRQFLDTHDEAYLATQRNGGAPPASVIEHYCRSRHADRVRVHLERCDRSLLQWDRRPIIDALELICRSHNEPTAALHGPRFRTDFLFKADLRFCAIMLRLADILDLDDTRAPQVIYEHLALSRSSSPEAAVSDREWHKHLASGGFEFPPSPAPNYTLQFFAQPTDPGVEHDLKAFLAVIKNEFVLCRTVADTCDDRWRGLALPGDIDATGITGSGYKYGEFRFELDRSSVLELFTGEQLYDDPYAFVRELLQNALDAIRARQHLFGHESAGIRVRCWEDDGGYLWVRLDDDGIGMDEATLRDYFLRIGKSYYRSAEFEAELARRGLAGKTFGVISRFGIGVLSCFMVGDQVEVSTRNARGGKAVRLSINRHEDYFVLQEQGMPGAAMPGPDGAEPPFLSQPGTHIAVRVNANRTGIALGELIARTGSFIFAPPVPIFINGRDAHSPTQRLVHEKALDTVEIAEIDPATFEQAEAPGLPYHGKIRVASIPLDLTAVTECPEVEGQLLAHVALPPADGDIEDLLAGWRRRADEMGVVLRTSVTSFEATLRRTSQTPRRARMQIRRRLSPSSVSQAIAAMNSHDPLGHGEGHEVTVAPEAHDDLRGLYVLSETLKECQRDPETPVRSSFLIPAEQFAAEKYALALSTRNGTFGYNGVAIPRDDRMAGNLGLASDGGIVQGAISLGGDLRPEMTVSRARTRGFSFPIHSAVHLAVRKAAEVHLGRPADWSEPLRRLVGSNLLRGLSPTEALTAAAFWSDRLLRDGRWNGEQLFETPDRTMSIDDLRAAARAGEALPIPLKWTAGFRRPPRLMFDFYARLRSALLHFFVDLVWVPGPSSARLGSLRVNSPDGPQLSKGSFFFDPLFAVPYRADNRLARTARHLNANHPLNHWLMDNAEVLAADFPAPFEQVLRPLRSVDAINIALDRVRQSRPEIAPPPEAYLRKDENGWWWSR